MFRIILYLRYIVDRCKEVENNGGKGEINCIWWCFGGYMEVDSYI